MLSRPWWLLLSLVALTAALLGALAVKSRAVDRQHNVSFARDMIQHHLQATDMATRLYERTHDQALRVLAYDILTSQTEQVGQMHDWLTQWNEPWGGPGMTGDEAASMGMASAADVKALSSAPLPQAENQFLKLMIRHHQGAVMMTRDALQRPLQPQVKALATQMQAAQAAEIQSMTALLRARGEAPLPALEPEATHNHG